jgi:thiol-disulfide isomerase/thioredoxin
MASTLKHVVSFGSLLLSLALLPACNRSGEPSAPVSSTGDESSSGTAVSSSAGDDSATSASPPKTDITSAFPLVEPARNADASAPPSTVPIQVVDLEEYNAVIGKHRGKVVLVDCWATWCGPCKEQFPHTVQLGRQHADRGLAVVSMSFNDPDQQPEVATFLEQQNAGFDHLISKFGASVESFVKFEIEGSALPYYKLYDRSGKLRYQFSGDNTDLKDVLKIEELDQRLEELLAENA